jgi:hypothetical protein
MNPEYKRVYHYHVRKTAGSSLNMAFWALGGPQVEEQFMDRYRANGNAVTGNGLKFVRGGPDQIASGDYFFAHTHIQAHRLEVPPGTFTITILRDPAARAISYYRYLLWARSDPEAGQREPFFEQVRAESEVLEGGPRYALAQLAPRALRTESAIRELGAGQFVARLGRLPRRGAGFSGFLDRVAPRRLMNQLYMFSARMDPGEAAERILACDAVCFTETFSDDLKAVAKALDLDLQERQERRFGSTVELSEGERDQLQECLAPEFTMMRRVREGLRERSQSPGSATVPAGAIDARPATR